MRRGCDGGGGGAGCERCARRNADGWREKAGFTGAPRARALGDGASRGEKGSFCARSPRGFARGVSGAFVVNGDSGWNGQRSVGAAGCVGLCAAMCCVVPLGSWVRLHFSF